MSEYEAVAHTWKMVCPQCETDDAIEIFATVWTRLKLAGVYELPAKEQDIKWDNESYAVCRNCGCNSPVEDFKNAYKEWRRNRWA
jgi:hypothetical protein